ncbi:uncharacterized protein ColSpa_05046 [Colletotrichum spaethianum]|uniref:Uncharacterized protein n=1 Tax=Colletotrichum spaethianum TaxID=700344 RepID=A0AA37LE35_9PEZI|nr:uncharacterized protein ColSpa_05046 [Colletotrichum spaethianum]GKT44865.1 hypothetical protein ColSpa_05046 [Colletotrichum spaethianum]
MSLPGASGNSSSEAISHALTPFGRAASRKYITRSFIFSFAEYQNHDYSEVAHAFVKMLENVLLRYPFLANHIKSDKHGLAELNPHPRPSPAPPEESTASNPPVPVDLTDLASELCKCQIHARRFQNGRIDFLEKEGFAPHWFRQENTCFILDDAEVDWEIGMPAMTVQADFLNSKTCNLILSFAVHHSLVDETSMNLIFQAFAADPPLSYAERNLAGYKLNLNKYRPTRPLAIDRIPEYEFDKATPIKWPNLESKPTNAIITITSARLNRLEVEVDGLLAHQGGGWRVSKLDCLSAWCWVAIIKSRLPGFGPKDEMCSATAVNVRPKLNPPLPETFFGE